MYVCTYVCMLVMLCYVMLCYVSMYVCMLVMLCYVSMYVMYVWMDGWMDVCM